MLSIKQLKFISMSTTLTTYSKETLVSYETAKLLKNAGFDWPCRWMRFVHDIEAANDMIGEETFALEDLTNAIENGYTDACLAPSQSVAQKWLREKHGLHTQVDVYTGSDDTVVYSPYTMKLPTSSWKSFDMHSSYEEALEAALQQALRLI